MTRARDVIAYMESLYNEEQRLILMRFFKTGRGEYGEGDEFLGLKVPQTRAVVKSVAGDLEVAEIPLLLDSKWHEVRLCGLLLLVAQFERWAKKRFEHSEMAIEKRDQVIALYLQYAHRANNWDLVDLSAPRTIGHWLLLPTHLSDKLAVLNDLALSKCLWKQRISMVSTWWPTHAGDPFWCLRYAEMHLSHRHDLMQKAVGWMLREMGKCVSMDLLRNFLQQHIANISRTSLRYAIEKMSEEERHWWLTHSLHSASRTM